MEIIYVSTPKKSNFNYCSEIFENKKPLNGFNKMLEKVDLFDRVDEKEFWTKNVKFDEEIIGELYLSYPFSVVVKETIKFSSLHELIKEIRRTYQAIYELEKGTSLKQAMPMCEEDPSSPLMNRNKTNGVIGIWGHDIGDLVIESITLYEGNLVRVGIGS